MSKKCIYNAAVKRAKELNKDLKDNHPIGVYAEYNFNLPSNKRFKDALDRVKPTMRKLNDEFKAKNFGQIATLNTALNNGVGINITVLPSMELAYEYKNGRLSPKEFREEYEKEINKTPDNYVKEKVKPQEDTGVERPEGFYMGNTALEEQERRYDELNSVDITPSGGLDANTVQDLAGNTYSVNESDITTYETESGPIRYITDENGDMVMLSDKNTDAGRYQSVTPTIEQRVNERIEKEYNEALEHYKEAGFTEQEIRDLIEGLRERYTKEERQKQEALENNNKGKEFLEENNFELDKKYSVSELSNKLKFSNKFQQKLFDLILAIANKLKITVEFASNYKGENYEKGVFDLNQNRIILNPAWINNINGLSTTVLHELIHGVTAYATSAVSSGDTSLLTSKQIKAIKSLTDILNRLRKLHGENSMWDKDFNSDLYGLENVDELLAELANPAFQQILKNSNNKEVKTLWQKIEQFFRDLFNIPSNEFDNVFKAFTDILQDFNQASLEEVAEKTDKTYSSIGEVTTQQKQQVSELFESNPELANEVYEALGLNTIDESEIIYTNEEGLPCAKTGLTNTVTGTNWRVVKDFKGQPKHSQGGVDITISDKRFMMNRNNGKPEIKAEFGVLLPFMDDGGDPPLKPVKGSMTEGQYNAAIKDYNTKMRMWNLNNNPERLKNESDESYSMRQKMFEKKRKENLSPIASKWESIKERQQNLPFVERTLSEVLSAPVDIAYNLSEKIDIKDNQKYKSEKQIQQDNINLVDSVLDASNWISPWEVGMKAPSILSQVFKKTQKELLGESSIEGFYQIHDKVYDLFSKKKINKKDGK